MKKLILLILLCAMGLNHLSTQTSTEWKHALIEDVNAGRFTDAIAKMPYASWEFDYDVVMDLDSAIAFYNQRNLFQNQPQHLIDSVNVYIANTFSAYGAYYYEKEMLDAAIQCYDIAGMLYQQENMLEDYARTLSNIGYFYRIQGKMSSTEQYYLFAARTYKNIQDKDDITFASYLDLLGVLYFDLGRYVDAEYYMLESWHIRKKLLTKEHPDYEKSLSNLGALYNNMGEYTKSEQYLLETMHIVKDLVGRNHPNYATCLHKIGLLYYKQANYAKAEQYYLEALQIRKVVYGETHIEYAYILTNIGMLYLSVGNYKEAEQYLLKSLFIHKEVLGEHHWKYASVMNNLGLLYRKMDIYFKSEKYYLEALPIFKEVFGENHPDYVTSLNNLGLLYYYIGNYDKAEQYYLEALQISNKYFSENPIGYINSLHRLGALYHKLNEYSKAEQYYLEVLQTRNNLLRENTLDVYLTYNLGALYRDMDNYVRAMPYCLQVDSLTKNQMLSSLIYMSERERSLFASSVLDRFINSLHIYYKASSSISAYNLLLFTKGLQLSMTNAIKRSIMESGDSALIADYEHLVTLKTYINKMETDNPTSPYLAQTRKQAEALEKDLTRRSTAFRENQRQWEITWQDVQASLPKKSVAIEFGSLRNDTCVALVLGKTDKEPRMITLSPDDIANRTLWNKLLPEFKGAQTIYFSPDGTLHQLPLESFAYDSTSTMFDHFNMVRLSSTRELVLHKQSDKQETATIYGGIQYNVSTDDLLAQSHQYDEHTLLAHRGIADDTTNRGSVQYLPGTKIEAEVIERVLQTNQISSRLYTATAANEESFKALSGQKQNILHIGTHGFCWSDSTAQEKELFAQRLQMIGDNQPHRQTIDPLDRCGLLFAGANIALSGQSNTLPSGVQDGILTAKEISLLDLRGCDLVVLSACETAKGDITSEGVFGLQRAFKMAGVQTIIMSLWSVDDHATQMLMTEFYTNWINHHQPKREAFKNAQNAVRYAVDEDGDRMFEDPVYWAGFIMLD